MLALILGGAPSVWADLAAARELLASRRHIVVACNVAGIHYEGQLAAWCSLHPDLLDSWSAQRGGNDDYRAFGPDMRSRLANFSRVAERWPGSSGLYAAQVALFEMGSPAAILCGVPMDREAGHVTVPGPWADTASYRRGFRLALPVIGARVRSMGGWSQELFGAPTTPWIEAVGAIRALGVTRPQNPGRGPMHTVKNVSETTQRFQVRGDDGSFYKASLGPGESGLFEINPLQGAFNNGTLEVSLIVAAAPAAAAAQAAAPTSIPPAQPEPAAPPTQTPPLGGA